MVVLSIDTQRQEELLDITALVQSELTRAEMLEGLCHLFCRHTTAGLTINENADPDVKRDVLLALRHMVPETLDYKHAEGNSTAHVKAMLMGCCLSVPVHQGRLALGRWQGIYLAEFDGPRRNRQISLTFTPAVQPSRGL